MHTKNQHKADILVADDSLDDLRLVVEVLSRQGYNVRPAIDGEAALASIRAEAPDLVLLDVRMPKLDGYEVCRQLKSEQPLLAIPVIFVSASVGVEDKVKAFSIGAVDYITKPYQAGEVLARVETHLSLYSMKKKIEANNVLLAKEISERKLMEGRLKRANNELEAFGYSVSHDLRAPLRHIDGFIKLLLEQEAGGLTDSSKRYMDIIAGATIKMGNLIDDLLALSRVTRAKLKRKPLDLNALIGDVIQEMTTDLPQRRIKWEIERLPKVQGDRMLLTQVFVNLIANAIKFTATRTEARVRIAPTETPANEISGPDTVTIFIEDNGVGFDPTYTNKLFGVFQRLHREEEFEGTGIGLAIVNRVISRHGGRIWAEGDVDKGAKFTFTLKPAKE